MITEAQREALRAICVEHGAVLVYLFGSQAEGTARSSSDVDVAILLPPGTPRDRFFEVRLALTNALMDALHQNALDVVVLNEAPPLLAHQVVKFGKIIYEDPLTQPAADFYVHTAARYADTAHTRQLERRYLHEWVEAKRTSLKTPAPTSVAHEGVP